MILLTVRLCLSIAGDAQCAEHLRYFSDPGECVRTGRAMIEWLADNADAPLIEVAPVFMCSKGRDV